MTANGKGREVARSNLCGVEVWRGGLGVAYLLPTLSAVGASLAPPCFRLSGRTVARDRASNDAAVSTVPPIIPYGGFSPVRLEGWRLQAIGQRLPSDRVD